MTRPFQSASYWSAQQFGAQKMGAQQSGSFAAGNFTSPPERQKFDALLGKLMENRERQQHAQTPLVENTTVTPVPDAAEAPPAQPELATKTVESSSVEPKLAELKKETPQPQFTETQQAPSLEVFADAFADAFAAKNFMSMPKRPLADGLAASETPASETSVDKTLVDNSTIDPLQPLPQQPSAVSPELLLAMALSASTLPLSDPALLQAQSTIQPNFQPLQNQPQALVQPNASKIEALPQQLPKSDFNQVVASPQLLPSTLPLTATTSAPEKTLTEAQLQAMVVLNEPCVQQDLPQEPLVKESPAELASEPLPVADFVQAFASRPLVKQVVGHQASEKPESHVVDVAKNDRAQSSLPILQASQPAATVTPETAPLESPLLEIPLLEVPPVVDAQLAAVSITQNSATPNPISSPIVPEQLEKALSAVGLSSNSIQEVHISPQRRELMVQLEPEHLGQLRVQLNSTGKNQVSARVVVDSIESQQLVVSQLGQLKSALQKQGITLDRLSVVTPEGTSQSGSFSSERFSTVSAAHLAERPSQQQQFQDSASQNDKSPQPQPQQQQSQQQQQQQAQWFKQQFAQRPTASQGFASEHSPANASSPEASAASHPKNNDDGSISLFV